MDKWKINRGLGIPYNLWAGSNWSPWWTSYKTGLTTSFQKGWKKLPLSIFCPAALLSKPLLSKRIRTQNTPCAGVSTISYLMDTLKVHVLKILWWESSSYISELWSFLSWRALIHLPLRSCFMLEVYFLHTSTYGWKNIYNITLLESFSFTALMAQEIGSWLKIEASALKRRISPSTISIVLKLACEGGPEKDHDSNEMAYC